MKTIINQVLTAASVTLLLASCKPELDIPKAGKGSLDVSTYVAIGSSMSAGYADNALYHDGQLYSYPNMIAQQLRLVGGGEFKQPIVSPSSVGIGASLNARMQLAPVTDCAGTTSLAPAFSAASGDLSILATSVAATGPFNNMSVPGLKATTTVYPGYGDYTQGAGNFNPFFTRMTANPQANSILGDAVAQNPTFFSLFIGSDDVMGYAISGAAADALTPIAGPAGFGFDASIDMIVNTLTANNAKGVVAGIPDVKNIPYFNTIPYNGLLLDAANAAALSAAYSPLGITFQAGQNAFIIEDGNAPAGLRQIAKGEMILLSVPQDSLKCGGWGSMKPIPDQYVLTSDELSEVNESVGNYNTKLKTVATDKNLAFVDVNAFMLKCKSGIVYNGVGLNAQFVTGGIFSLDGIHLTPRGNALLANEFIKAINSKYGATIPQLNATQYRGVLFP